MKRHRPPTRPDLEASALPMFSRTEDPGEQVAASLGIPFLRFVDGWPTFAQPRVES